VLSQELASLLYLTLLSDMKLSAITGIPQSIELRFEYPQPGIQTTISLLQYMNLWNNTCANVEGYRNQILKLLLDEPGHDPKAPYNKEHIFAEKIERQIAEELGVDWEEYSRVVESL
jgi:hypothetical protein